MDEAQKGMEQLSSCMVQTKIASLAMTAAFAMQAAPLAIFYDIGKKVYANLIGWVTEFNEKNDGLPQALLYTTAVFVGLLAITGYLTKETIAWGTGMTYIQALWNQNIIVSGIRSAVLGTANVVLAM